MWLINGYIRARSITMLRKVLVVCTGIKDYLVFIHIGKKVVIRNSTELRLVANMYEKVRGTTTDWM